MIIHRKSLRIGALVIAAVLTAALAACQTGVMYCKSSPEDGTFDAARRAHSIGSIAATGLQARQSAPTGSLPALDEEVWVIIKSPMTVAAPQPQQRDEIPGCGALMCRLPSPQPQPESAAEPRDAPLPLKHTDVRASISAYIASVEVTQQFHNPYDSKIEAVYVFPLPENAAVSGFVMTIGERKIRGIIREREEATQVYEQARRQGYVASLLTQERPDIFTQKVANIEPGKQIDVNITYFHTLSYDDGWYEFVYPMVVGPRFNPPALDPARGSDGIGSVARGRHGASGQSTEVQYLRPGERSGYDIALQVDIDAGVTIEEIACRSHQTQVSRAESEQMRVTLAPGASVPNKDFVLRYRIAGDKVKSAVLVQRDDSGASGYLALMLYPPRDLKSTSRQPMEMIFVLDCSGSMRGRPLEQAKDAVQHALQLLQPQDTFQIVRFSDTATQLGLQPLPATEANVKHAREYVRSLVSEGGTMMIHGIRAALAFDHDPERLRVVTFLTDGYIGNECDILAEIHHHLGATRVFSFGVGSSPNRSLMSAMARAGQGTVAYLGLNDDGGDVMDRYFQRVSHAVLTDIRLDWGGTNIEAMPQRVPDLFVGRPVAVLARYQGATPQQVRVTGSAGGRLVMTTLDVHAENAAEHRALAGVWARMHIADLSDRMAWDTDAELPLQIKSIAIQYGLMSAYTAFVAVDSTRRTEGDHGTAVTVAVPVPEGVRYDTTVQEQ